MRIFRYTCLLKRLFFRAIYKFSFNFQNPFLIFFFYSSSVYLSDSEDLLFTI